MPAEVTDWHVLTADQAAQAVASDLAAGLAEGEAASRLERFGPNVLPEAAKRTLLAMFLGQFKDVLVLVLVAACGVSFLLGEITDAVVILAILVLNAVLGVFQEHKADRALEALKKMSVPVCEVLRGGRQLQVPSQDLVPGDVVVLRDGDAIPADLRLIEAYNLQIDEASLTGESVAVEKSTGPLAARTTLAERADMAYAGTHVTYGRGRGLVVATGMDRQIGHIAALLQEAPATVTPLQRNLAGLGKLLGVLTLVTCAMVFVSGLLWSLLRPQGQPMLDVVQRLFMTSVSLAVAAIPEGLPAVTTIVLALGVYRMSRHHAIVRRLPAVETLGCATCICTDKTGTLTENRMTVTKAVTAEQILTARRWADCPGRDDLLAVAALCNDARVDAHGRRFGEPTELALVEYVNTQPTGSEELRHRHPRVDELPFSSARKLMSTLNRVDGRTRLMVKGAPDVLLHRCTHVLIGGRVEGLSDRQKDTIARELTAMAGSALRVLGFAWRDLEEPGRIEPADENELVFVGLMGLIDPPRPQVRRALEEARSAGISTVMVTGDNAATARAIAEQLGMLGEGEQVVSSGELEAMTDQELQQRIGHIRVFARVHPEQKLRIVQAFQARGEVVAVTGDGVNDAPAIKRADIGLAMGVTGTDVAKETADMVLADDNYATIVEAIEQGRAIFDNIRKFVLYLLACNVGEVLVVFIPILLGFASPLAPVQILLINLITDGLPALALGVDPPEPGVMRRRPRKAREGIVGALHLSVIGFNAVFIAAAVLLSFLAGKQWDLPIGQEDRVAETMAFITLALAELSRAYSFRSETQNFWRIDPRTNPQLLLALGISAVIAVATVLGSPLRGVFGTAWLTGQQWAVAVGCSLIPFAAFEAYKAVRARTTQVR
ncbi:MAG: calcium-translocating P-type ATPase, PMCA-type [Phycisphaerae bacterium]|nr:calcium-translocating P-type ATPase, PMCA-type [Phycisphaerae bacterium]